MLLSEKNPVTWGFLIGLLFLCSCAGSQNDKEAASTTNGRVHVTIDESLQPVMAQQVKVFDSSFPNIDLQVTYAAEHQCIKDLFTDSSRLIITTRPLTESEKELAKKNEMPVHSMALAQDAIALIVSPQSPDSFMTVGQLRSILTGNFSREYSVVFDNAQSGLIRYVMDSIINGAKLSSRTYAVGSDDSVIRYVATHERALGILGVTQVYDPTDKSGAGKFKEGINVVALKDTATGEFFQPYQAYIYYNQYPLTRKIYFISRENWPGPASGFANFLSGQRGQLIFKKARLIPLRANLRVRPAVIK